MSVFYGKWDAGYHQYHFVGTGGYILVHPALHVRELSLQFVLGSSSHTYFIGYKDEGCVLCREAVEFRLGSGKCPGGIRLEVEEEIGTPQGDAVYQDDPPLQPVAAEFFLLFDVCPFRSPAFLMLDYPLAEFFVPDACCGKINGSGRELECQLFRIGAFAGSFSSGDEYVLFDWFLVCILNEYLCFPEL